MSLDFIKSWPIWLQIISYIALLAVGTLFLVKFCDIFVDSASSLAKKLKISSLVIGLTIVAMGTSCPELAVSVSDSISTLKSGADANIAIGNVVGSNICNTLLVLGFSAVFTPILVDKSVVKRDFPFLLVISAIFVVFGVFFGINSVTENYAILRWEGLVFVALFIVYITFLVLNTKHKIKHEPLQALKEDLSVEVKEMPLVKSILLLLLGIVGIALGGEAVVIGAKGIALIGTDALSIDHNLAESLVGLTIVAVGTSLPELVTSVVAAKKGQDELALGNVIGSNIFNVLFVLGLSAVVSPLTTGFQTIIDLAIMMVVTIIVFVISLKGKISKKAGFAMLMMYLAYLIYLIIRTVI